MVLKLTYKWVLDFNATASWSSGNEFVCGAGGQVSISGGWNRTQCCQRLVTAATILRKELCYPGAMTRRWAPPTRYTLWRNTASMKKNLILIWLDLISLQRNFINVQNEKLKRNFFKCGVYGSCALAIFELLTNSMVAYNFIFPADSSYF